MNSTLQLSKNERDMMKEISQVFSKYSGKTRQFGLQLIHSHFDIDKDEILYEVHDKQSRTLITRPTKKETIKEALATAWEIDEMGKVLVTSLCCTIIGPPPPSRKVSVLK